MNKKLISVLLAVSMIIASTYVTVFADKGSSDPEVLLSALGIMGNVSEQADEFVKRSDAAYYALKVSGYKNIPVFTESRFSDVTSSTSNADSVNYCVDLGIISPADTFEPERNVTISEFLKMIECALGYGAFANKIGGYPNGYMQLASSLGMTNAFAVSAESNIRYKDLGRFLTGILMSKCLEESSTNEYKVNGDNNILYKVFDVYKITGTVTANSVTSLTIPQGVGKNNIKIEDDIFSVEPNIYASISNSLGYEINAWANEDTDTIICYEARSTMEVEIIRAEDFKSIKNGVLSYENNKRAKSVNLPASCRIIYNGKAITEDIEGNVFNNRWGNVKLVKGTDKKVKTVIITAYDDYFVTSIDSSNYICYDNTANNHNISFAKDGGEISEFAYFRDNIGNVMSFSDITPKSVISVAQNGDYYDCIITKESVTGVLTDINQTSGERPEIYINANHYTLSPEMDDSRIMQLKAGNTYTFYIDADGRVAAGILETSTNNELSWVYLIDIIKSENVDDELYFKVLTPSDGVISIKNAERMFIDGESFKNNISGIMAKFAANGVVTRQAMKINVDDAGDIYKVDTVYYNPATENKADSVRCFYDNEGEIPYCKAYINSFGLKFTYTGSTIVFNVPQNDSVQSSDYTSTSPDVFVTDQKYNISAYNTNKYSRTADVIVCTDSIASSTPMWIQDYLTVVSDICTVMDDGETAIQLTGYQKGVEKKWILEKEDLIKIKPTENQSYLSDPTGTITIGKGDTIRYSKNKDDKIDNIQLVFDASEKQYYAPVPIEGESSDNITHIGDLYGRMEIGVVTPYRIMDGGVISATDMNLDPDSDEQKYITSKLSTYKIYTIEVAGNTASVKIGSQSDIPDWYNHGSDDSKVVIQNCRYDEGRDLIIYKY